MKNRSKILIIAIFALIMLAFLGTSISAASILPGDMNGDSQVNVDDAIYLLRHTFKPNDYPIPESADVNGDSEVSVDDAIYLLRHTFKPEDYPIISSEHTLTRHAARAATCAQDGNVEYWSCSDCGKNFTNAAATTELKNVIIPATGHKLNGQNYANYNINNGSYGVDADAVVVPYWYGYADPTGRLSAIGVKPFAGQRLVCESTDLGYFYCEECDNVVTVNVYYAHNGVSEILLEPTCQSTGMRKVDCDNCNYDSLSKDSYDLPVEIKPLPHLYSYQLVPTYVDDAVGQLYNLVGTCYGNYCDTCSDVKIFAEAIYNVDAKELKTPTCLEFGEIKYIFKKVDCSPTYSVTVKVPRTYHILNGDEVKIGANSVVEGFTTATPGVKAFGGSWDRYSCGYVDGYFVCEYCSTIDGTDSIVAVTVWKDHNYYYYLEEYDDILYLNKGCESCYSVFENIEILNVDDLTLVERVEPNRCASGYATYSYNVDSETTVYYTKYIDPEVNHKLNGVHLDSYEGLTTETPGIKLFVGSDRYSCGYIDAYFVCEYCSTIEDADAIVAVTVLKVHDYDSCEYGILEYGEILHLEKYCNGCGLPEFVRELTINDLTMVNRVEPDHCNSGYILYNYRVNSSTRIEYRKTLPGGPHTLNGEAIDPEKAYPSNTPGVRFFAGQRPVCGTQTQGYTYCDFCRNVVVINIDVVHEWDENSECTRCGEMLVVHDLTHYEAIPATCTEDGNVEYWYCSDCEKYFADEDATTELYDIVIPAAHTFSYYEENAATCTEDGIAEYWYCFVCDKMFADEAGTTELESVVVIPSTGHILDGNRYEIYDMDGDDSNGIIIPYWHGDTDIYGRYTEHHNVMPFSGQTFSCVIEQNGYFHCESCGDTIGIIVFYDHNGESRVISPTCCSVGYREVNCDNCDHYSLYNGRGYPESEVPMIPHIYTYEIIEVGNTTVDNNDVTLYNILGTCQGNGKKCTANNGSPATKILVENIYNIESQILKAPNCLEYGEVKFTFNQLGSNERIAEVFLSDKTDHILNGKEVKIGEDHISDLTTSTPGIKSFYSQPFDDVDCGEYVHAYFLCEYCYNIEGANSVVSVTVTKAHSYEYAFYEKEEIFNLELSCEDCDYLETIELTEEDLTIVDHVDPNYCIDGYTVYSYTVNSESTLEYRKIIPGGAHILNGEEIDSGKAYPSNTPGIRFFAGQSPVCGTQISGYATCEICNEGVEIKKINVVHEFDEIGECTRCGEMLVVHNLIHYESVPATCTEDGNVEYWYCSDCDKYFTGKDAIVELYDVIILAGHVCTNGQCENCDYRHSVGLSFASNGDGTCYVSGIGDCTDTDIVIPPTSPDGDSVTGIGDYAFYYCYDINSVVIPDGVTSIGDYAFGECYSLISVEIPNSMTRIGDYAFAWCESLSSAVIGDSVTSIDYYAFYCCYSLTSITVDSGNEYYKSIDGNLYTKDGKTLIQYAVGKPNTEFTIPDGVTCINDCAFRNCASLTSVIIPGSVSFIGDYTFCNCISLINITVDSSNEYYKSVDGNLYTIDGNTLIQYVIGKTNTEFTVPDGVTSISKYAFAGCTSLSSVVIGDGVTNIDWGAFSYCTNLSSVEIPASMNRIGDYVFDGCESLTDVYYDGNAQDFSNVTIGNGNGYFTNATIHYNSTEVTYSEGLEFTSNGNGTCYVSGIGDCTDVHVAIPTTSPDGDRVTGIGESAFSRCTNLTSVIIPDSVTSIGDDAFYFCINLDSVEIGNGVTHIGDMVFYGSDSISSITVGSRNGDYKSIDGNLYTIDGQVLVQYAVGKSATEFIIPDGVTSIGAYAFTYCENLSSVRIPNSVTTIGDEAFFDCTNLSSIEIPNGVTSIGTCAFGYCENLSSIEIPDSVTSIGAYAFTWCENLSSVKIGNNLTSISTYAFSYCLSLSSVEIPSSVTSIDGMAFYWCDSLTDVYYRGSEADWQNIVIGYLNEDLTDATIYYNYAG